MDIERVHPPEADPWQLPSAARLWDFKTWSLQAQLAPLCPLLLALLHPVSWCCLVQAHSPVGNALLPQAMPELSNIR